MIIECIYGRLFPMMKVVHLDLPDLKGLQALIPSLTKPTSPKKILQEGDQLRQSLIHIVYYFISDLQTHFIQRFVMHC